MNTEWIPLSEAYAYVLDLVKQPDRAKAEMKDRLRLGQIGARADVTKTTPQWGDVAPKSLGIVYLASSFWRQSDGPDSEGGIDVKFEKSEAASYRLDAGSNPIEITKASMIEVYLAHAHSIWPPGDAAASGAPRHDPDRLASARDRRRGRLPEKMENVLAAMRQVSWD